MRINDGENKNNCDASTLKYIFPGVKPTNPYNFRLSTQRAPLHLIPGTTPTVQSLLNHITPAFLSACPPSTWHIRRTVPIARAPDSQLAKVVVAPALDAASGNDRAHVVMPRGDGGC